jgi:phospholipid-translocating ATPase
VNSGEDDAPLLANGSARRRRPSLEAFNKIGSHLRLPSFLSAAAGSPPQPEEDAQDEEDPASSRILSVGTTQSTRFPPNAVSNAKYTPVSFLPVTLYNEFSFFFNMYFLLVALSQAIPPLRIGYLSTYIVPLAFVLAITLGKEAFDDIERRRRDNEANSEGYTVLCFDRTGTKSANGDKGKKKLKSTGTSKTKRRSLVEPDRLSDIQEEEESAESCGRRIAPTTEVREVIKKSRDLKVGDVLKLGKDQRVPADVVILKSFPNETTVVVPEDGIQDDLISHPLLVEPISDPPIDQMTATMAEAHESTSELGNTPSADADGVGETFIRTDQLDGETDWKLRLGSPLTQNLETSEFVRLRVVAGKPDKKVNEFIGTVELLPKSTTGYDAHAPKLSSLRNEVDDAPPQNTNSAPLTIDNTAWCNTVLASNATTLAVIVYTGSQTRSALSTSPSRSKTGLLEYEINSLTKILCALTLTLSIVLVALEGFEHVEGVKWYVKIMRFLVLFSTIVPISLRVNLDMGKSVYSWFIQRDPGIAGAVVRTSTIPEELGRIEYLLTDKTGTLTQNEMEMKKIHVGTVSYANEAMDEVASYIRQGFSVPAAPSDASRPAMLITPSSNFLAATTITATRTRREIGSRVRDVVLALAICHNVTPTVEEEDGHMVTSYQASSPDEIAIVKWTEAVGLRLMHRDRKGMSLQSVDTGRLVVRVRILEVFPFTSDGKRMGIIVQFRHIGKEQH